MTSISRDVYIDKLADIAQEHNDTNQRTTKRKPVDVKSSTYIDFDVETNEKDPEFKVEVHARTSKYKNISAKGYTSNWSK